MKKNDLPEEVNVIGYVRATDWDGDDAVSAVSISTYGEEYVVEPNSLGEELFGEVNSEVEIWGIVRKDRDGTKRITVTSYEVLSESNENEDAFSGYDDNGEELEGDKGKARWMPARRGVLN